MSLSITLGERVSKLGHREQQLVFESEKAPLLITLKSIEKDTWGQMQAMLWHAELEVKYITSGKAVITIEDKEYSVKKGDIIIVNPYESHKMTTDGVNYYILLCSTKYFLKKFDSSDFYEICMPFISGQLKFESVVTNPEIGETLKKICQAKELKYSYVAQESLLNYFFAQLFSCVNTYSVGIDKALLLREKNKIEPAIQYIDSNISEELDIEKLASLCHVNKFYFSRLFKRALKVTPHDYISKIREEKAEYLLLCTDKKISAIAKEIGLNDEFYFSRWFKKRHGISPNEYRAKGK